jgi:exosortase N
MAADYCSSHRIVSPDKEKKTPVCSVMNISLNLLMQQNRRVKPVFLFLATYLLVAVFTLKDYLPFGSFQFLIGLPGLCFALHIEKRGAASNRFLWIALLFLLLCCWLPVKTFLYFTLSFAILSLLESSFGKTGLSPIIMVVLLSPVFKYAVNTFSWPIRLGLTRIAGSLFSASGIETVIKGNVIIQGNQEFSIDPGCMGLSMMTCSLLLGAIVLAWFQHGAGRSIKPGHLLFFFGFVIGMNIIANLFRIMILVYFAIPPESFIHDLAGIACLLPYVFYPSVCLAEYLAKRGSLRLTGSGLPGKLRSGSLWLHTLLLVIIISLGFKVMYADTYKMKGPVGKIVHGYEASLYEPGITKLSNPNSLVYIKQIRGFYDTDHNPMICWKGSGYTLDHTEKRALNGQELFTSWLINGNEKLYTAWWYSNGTDAVTSQLDWRWNMLSKKQSYALVNITCSTPALLEEEIKKLKDGQILKLFIQ